MKLDTKCSLALHCILFIAVYQDKVKVTSEILSKSTGSNPVMIRNTVSALKKAGIVSSPRGVGGARIACDLEKLSLWDVYSAIEPDGLDNFIGRHSNPSEFCPLGRRINEILDLPYQRIGEAVRKEMTSISVKELLDDYYSKKNQIKNQN